MSIDVARERARERESVRERAGGVDKKLNVCSGLRLCGPVYRRWRGG